MQLSCFSLRACFGGGKKPHMDPCIFTSHMTCTHTLLTRLVKQYSLLLKYELVIWWFAEGLMRTLQFYFTDCFWFSRKNIASFQFKP